MKDLILSTLINESRLQTNAIVHFCVMILLYITKQIGDITMPKPVTKNGVTIFELSPEEKKVVELEKRVRQLEESNQKILERLENSK